MRTENCTQCRWFEPGYHDKPDQPVEGTCHFHPPVYVGTETRFPVVYDGDFCSRFISNGGAK